MVSPPAQISSLVPSSPLAQRIAHPSAPDRKARAETQRYYAAKNARTRLRKMQERMAALASNQQELAQLTRTVRAEVPNKIEEASWGGDIAELAEKIQRQSWGLLEATEAPVRDADRQLVLRKLPPCFQVNKDDVRYVR